MTNLNRNKVNYEWSFREWFQGFKKDCPDGQVTPVKFVESWKNLFPYGNAAEQYCNHVFRAFDSDKNGYIDFKEFLIAIYITSSGNAEEKLKLGMQIFHQ